MKITTTFHSNLAASHLCRDCVHSRTLHAESGRLFCSNPKVLTEHNPEEYISWASPIIAVQDVRIKSTKSLRWWKPQKSLLDCSEWQPKNQTPNHKKGTKT